MDKIPVLDIPIFDKSIPVAVSRITSICLGSRENRFNRCISATDAHGIVYSKKNSEFRETLNQFYLRLPDGMPIVWVGRLKGAKQMGRCYGPDFFKEVMIASGDKPIRHYLCGGKYGVAEDLRFACADKFKNTNIVGTYCPPFRTMTDDEFRLLANDINSKNADIVWVGLGTPKQELFAVQLAKFTKVHFIVTVGAAFDFHTGRVAQAPKFLQKSGLEWFFRLCMEPRRLYGRYAEVVPAFVYFNLKEYIFYLLKKYRYNS